MKYKITTIFVAIVLATLVWLTISHPETMISPGKPIDAHAEVASDCFACHTSFLGSTPGKCIECHKVDEIGIRTTQGLPVDKEDKNAAFHQQLIEEDCVACHSEHKGVQPFRPIGQFSHQLVKPNLIEECNDCHTNPGDSLHRQITGKCSTCHSQERWTPATFDHNEYFRFDKHHRTECETCHVDNNYDNYTCYGCHEHSRSKIRHEHAEEGIRDYEQCTECHRSGNEHEAKRIWKSKRRKSSGYMFESEHHEDDDDDD